VNEKTTPNEVFTKNNTTRQRMKRFTRRKLMMKILKKHGHVCNHKVITHSKDM